MQGGIAILRRKVYGLIRMSDTTTGTAPDTTVEGEGSEDTQTQTQKPSGTEDPIALARKRQAGAEAARQKAEEARDAALKELEGYRSKERTEQDQSLADNAKLRERLDFEKARADEAEARAEARILDFKYPNARAELPDVTDEVKLARFEALLASGEAEAEGDKTPPPPQNPNASNRAASGDATALKPKDESSQDILAKLKAQFPGGRPE